MKQRLIALMLALVIGLTLFHFHIPIPFMLSGIIAASFLKFFVWRYLSWPISWRNLGLMVAGYGIGRDFTQDTLLQMSQQLAGVFGASLLAIGISLLVAWVTYKHTFANLLSCVMGMLPGGLNQMMLMAAEDPRVDANVVVMQQTIRLFGVVITVPFLVIHLLGATVSSQGLLTHANNTGLPGCVCSLLRGWGLFWQRKSRCPRLPLSVLFLLQRCFLSGLGWSCKKRLRS